VEQEGLPPWAEKVQKRQIKLINILRTTINPLTPELNPSAQRRLPRLFTGDLNF
jgi:hypothetical protein